MRASQSGARKAVADIYRPGGPKFITTVNGLTGAAPTGFTKSVVQDVDLTLPLYGFRLVISGRVAVGTANYSSVNPESLLNLISEIVISGTNTRLNGNVTLLDMDLASLVGFQFLTQRRAPSIIVNSSLLARPGIPYSNIAALTTAGSPYDFRIVVDIPFAPFGTPGGVAPGFLVRQSEWKQSVKFTFKFPTITDNAANALGTSAATTVTTISSIGSGSGAMTVDIYALPLRMGSRKDAVVPGVLSRTTSPIDTILQTTKTGVQLLRLEKQATSRVYLKIGVGTASPIFTSLSDAILTAYGLQVGTSVNVRDKADIWAKRMEEVNHYGVDPVQGYFLEDFIQSGNPDSSYAADSVLGDGQTFALVGDVTGTANAAGLILQEQIVAEPS